MLGCRVDTFAIGFGEEGLCRECSIFGLGRRSHRATDVLHLFHPSDFILVCIDNRL